MFCTVQYPLQTSLIPDTAVKILDALEHKNELKSHPELREYCLHFIAENLKELAHHDDFPKLSFDNIFTLMNTMVEKEDNILRFDAIKLWFTARRTPKPTIDQFKRLIGTIDWTKVSREQFGDIFVGLENKKMAQVELFRFLFTLFTSQLFSVCLH